MDLTKLVPRLAGRQKNSIYTFEKGRVVQRTHATLYSDVQAARARLVACGVKKGDRVGIRAQNCYQWIVYDLALIELRAVSVAFTEDFAEADARELCDKYKLSLMLVMASEGSRHTPDATFLACIDDENASAKAIDRGDPAADENFDRPWLIFSSGSSGGIKGLTLNRKGVEAWVEAFTGAVVPRQDDCLLLFLPISNFQQRPIYYAALWYGFDFIVTDPARLFLALKQLKPTILIAPPALYEAFETRFYNLAKWRRFVAQAAGEVVRRLPVRTAREKLARLIFKQAYEALGGRMRFMVTGMAPIKRTTLDLFARMQLPLYETYGLVECGSVALNVPGANKVGSVGRPLPGLRVELAEDGEIIVRREHMTALGYFECVEGESETTFIGNNCVATGDIGRFDEDGYLYLVGRKKEIIITAGGEKVHPEAIESLINSHPDVAKSVVLAGPSAASLFAIVLPKDPYDSAAKARIESFVEGINENRPAMSVGKVVFTEMLFLRENGFLRPNLKLDRKRIADHFRPELSEIGV
ncbi:MAG TPA: AMP-binding protein [Blastocatellia bacterium]